ncbi:hypothetical protein TSAR_012501 [Trichomalopsis sarcophagae]|uniref:DUF4708 domain-containing protein n=1 Tax=Trichomalopsis sarcophagae TaxID=543379 RepID=A0A232F2Q8_9HYME|nr:hypothetical protein TSAR_012501 [Trichomalopsis sarcophagae]
MIYLFVRKIYFRLIIYSVRCCVASPSIQNVGDAVHVVVSRKFFTTGKLQEHLNELKIKFSDPEEVHPKIYEACLKYTFTFKIAPHWNLIGTSLYLQGCNFLPFPPAINALDWNVHYKDDDTKIELKPMKLNIHTLTLEFLKIPPSILDNFISNPNCTIDTINLTLFPCPWVYVLPKLTRARLLSVSRTLPDKCPFDTYNDLRRHWKNMYSYRLPKTSDGMLFYEVVFPSYPNEPFIYPEACLLSKTPEFLTCENKNEIASGFLKDLAQNVHAVCGEVIHIGHIYPTLNVEYSCSIKNRYGREYEEILNKYKSPFFRMPSDECIIIPANSQPNLSSKITIHGMDKMKTPMRNHTQRILSIMDNHKRSKKHLQNNNSQFLSQMPPKNKDKKFGTQKFGDLPLPENDEPTIIDNTDDIISFYDIPSMYPKTSHSSETTEENKDAPEKNKENELNSNSKNVSAAAQQLSHSKPVIKNVENVHFDISAIKKVRTNNKRSRQNDKPKNVKTDKLKKTTVKDSYKTSNSLGYTPNSFERIRETFFPSEKSKAHYDGFQKFDFKNEIESFKCSQPQILKSSSQTTVNTNKSLEINKSIQAESNEDLRKELADFDKYNLGNNNNETVGRNVSGQGNNFSFEAAKEQEQKFSRFKNQKCGDKNLKLDDSYKVSDQSKFHRLNEEFNSPQNLDTFSNLSPSLLDYKRSFKLHTIDHEKLKEILREEHSPENSEPCKSETDEEEEIQCSPSLLEAITKYFDSPKHDNQMDFEESDPSIKTYTNVKPNEKMSQDCKAIETDQISKSFSFYRNQNNSYNISPISSPNTDMFEGSTNRKLLQTCKSPLSISSKNGFEEINSSKDFRTDKENVFNNPQYSPSIFEKYESQRKTSRESSHNQSYQSYLNKDVQNTKSVKSNEIQGHPPPPMDVDNSDFHSILSESSDESNSEKYESYKQACTEALTFN